MGPDDNSAAGQGTPIAEVGVGLLSALYLLIGGWSPGRLAGEYDPTLLQEPRFWLATLLLLVAVAISHRWRRRSDRSPRRPARSWFVSLASAYLIYTVATAIWAPDGELALAKLGEVLTIGLAFLGVTLAMEVVSHWRVSRVMWDAILAVTLALAVLALPASLVGGRVAVMGGGPNVFARLMSLLFITGVHGLAVGRRRGFWVAITLLSGMLVVLSGSRGAMLALCVTVAASGVAYRMPVRRVMFVAASGISLAWLVYVVTPLGQLVRAMFAERVLLLTVEQAYTSQRDVILALAWDLGAQNLFHGVGLAGFHATYPIYAHPHNILMEAFSEGGIVGVVLLGTALGFAMRVTLSKEASGDYRAALAFTMLFVASQFSGDIYDARGLLLLPLLVAQEAPRL